MKHLPKLALVAILALGACSTLPATPPASSPVVLTRTHAGQPNVIVDQNTGAKRILNTEATR